MQFQDLLNKYRAVAWSEKDNGARFERLMRAFLKTYPAYTGQFRHVWLWGEFPYRKDFGGKDTGIDLVAQTVEGDYWAVQCKCWDDSSYIDKPAVDSFLATSSKSFMDGDGRTATFSLRLWLSTTNKWGHEAENAIKHQNPPVQRLGLADLETAPVDWAALENGASGAKARASEKTFRPHQAKALDLAHKHFQTADRGQLVMACGTGKTFTALKIAEKEAPSGGLVLFLAPSIALVGQTLQEWMAEAERPLHPICVCSDPEVSKKKIKDEDEGDGFSVVDLARPATTEAGRIAKQIELAAKPGGLTVVFSTYQSIEKVALAQQKFKREFDLIVCDEAHRTTGVTLKETNEAAFVRVHDQDFLPGKKRLYMTATPRLYHETSKQKAKEAQAVLCSMDDEALYGPEIYRLGFGEAVDQKLLADYKVLVLTLPASQILPALQKSVADKNQEITTDDAAKLIGRLNALSKRMLIDEGLLKATDPSPMRRAVAFCQTIKKSEQIAGIFNRYQEEYCRDLEPDERAELAAVTAEHIDGTMGASLRQSKLAWLKSVTDGTGATGANECQVLTNVRCLSERVDVPSLDAVMFLSARNSQIDVVQSVGRVMRVASGKKYGYIIIPVLIPSESAPEEVLKAHDSYRVVWMVLNALRAHDDRFNAMVEKINLNQRRPSEGGSVLVGGVPGPAGEAGEASKSIQISLPFKEFRELQNAIYARMLQKVGRKGYLTQWAQDVAKIAQGYMERLNGLVAQPGPHQEAFQEFLVGLRKNLNPSVDAAQVVEMLAQHLITKPVCEALFENYSFVQNNPVSQALQKVADLLEEQALEKDTLPLSRFYAQVKNNVASLDNAEARQKVITGLYEEFFKTAFPKVVERLGIVYTPMEVVDFILRSVAAVLEKEFGRKISDENVHILDPFTGTGTFLVRLLQSGLITGKALARKYEKELHANEIILLAYYIASINIENAFHEVMGGTEAYKPFPGICLTNTFQLGEAESPDAVFSQELTRNSARVQDQMKAPIRVILGNPPYSVGQKSANDNAQNQSYPGLKKRIAYTYVKLSKATLTQSLYDTYVKAFRWSSDRLDEQHGGVIAFVSNAGWLDGKAMDGMRKCLGREFSAIYVFNLRGNQRTSGEISRREGGKIFGSGSRTSVVITVLVKKPVRIGPAAIYYHDIGDYLNREEKLALVAKKKHILGPDMKWAQLLPNEHGDWLNQRSNLFQSFIPIEPKIKFSQSEQSFFYAQSLGVATSRNYWVYNYSKNVLKQNITKTISHYNEQRVLIQRECVEPFREATKGIWSRDWLNAVKRNHEFTVNSCEFRVGIYRPFTKLNHYFDDALNQERYRLPSLFPTIEHENLLICISGVADAKEFACMITDTIPDLHVMSSGTQAQCFPLYYYAEKPAAQRSLLDPETVRYERRDGLTDFILAHGRERYGPKTTKEDIFYYVYGLLHSPDYRQKFAAEVKKMLPRLPLVDKPADFRAFSQAGRALAELHLNYEDRPTPAKVKVMGAESGKFQMEKMRFAAKGDKSAIDYNAWIKVTNIPEAAYEYVINGRSAIEWIMGRYQVKTDRPSGIHVTTPTTGHGNTINPGISWTCS